MSRDGPGQNHFPKRNQKIGKGRCNTEEGHSKTGKDILTKERKVKVYSKTGKDVLKQEKNGDLSRPASLPRF